MRERRVPDLPRTGAGAFGGAGGVRTDAVHAPAAGRDASELLHVHVDQVADALILVADDLAQSSPVAGSRSRSRLRPRGTRMRCTVAGAMVIPCRRSRSAASRTGPCLVCPPQRLDQAGVRSPPDPPEGTPRDPDRGPGRAGHQDLEDRLRPPRRNRGHHQPGSRRHRPPPGPLPRPAQGPPPARLSATAVNVIRLDAHWNPSQPSFAPRTSRLTRLSHQLAATTPN